MSLLDDVRALLAKRRLAVLEVESAVGAVLLLDQGDPAGGVAAGDPDDPAALVEVWASGDLLCLDAAEIGTLRFDSADELDRFLADLLDRGWANLHPDDYRIVP